MVFKHTQKKRTGKIIDDGDGCSGIGSVEIVFLHGVVTRLYEHERVLVVGEHEANIEKGLLNIKSPIARALIGKDEGDSVEVRTPGGDKSYEVLKIEYI